MSVVLNTFAAGLHNRPDPSLISADSAEVFHNIDNSGGVIKSLKKPKDSGMANLSAGSSFFMNERVGESPQRVDIHTDSPYVIYDKWLFHRDENGKLKVSQWRDFPNDSGFDLSTYIHKDRFVGLNIPQQIPVLSRVKNDLSDDEIQETFGIRNVNLNQYHAYTFNSNEYMFRRYTPIFNSNTNLTIKFVLLDENNNRIWDKDYTTAIAWRTSVIRRHNNGVDIPNWITTPLPITLDVGSAGQLSHITMENFNSKL